MEQIRNRTGMSIKIRIRMVVSDSDNLLSGDRFHINLRSTSNFSSDNKSISRDKALTSYSGLWVLNEVGIKNGVRDSIADFIRMSWGDGFRSKVIHEKKNNKKISVRRIVF